MNQPAIDDPVAAVAPESTGATDLNPDATDRQEDSGGGGDETAAEPVLPATLAPVQGQAAPPERRAAKRHSVRWRGYITVQPKTGVITYRARILEISLTGCVISVERNLQGLQTASLIIEVPALAPVRVADFVRGEGRLLHAFLSAQHKAFVAAFHFTKFQEGSRAALEAALASL